MKLEISIKIAVFGYIHFRKAGSQSEETKGPMLL